MDDGLVTLVKAVGILLAIPLTVNVFCASDASMVKLPDLSGRRQDFPFFRIQIYALIT